MKLFGHWRRPPIAPVAPVASSAASANGQERRAAVRYRTNAPIWFRRPGVLPVAGTLINISMTGAMVRITQTGRAGETAWPHQLVNGDDVSLWGLHHDDVSGWVVAVDGEMLRMRFYQDEATRTLVRDLIEQRLAPKT